MRGRYSSSLEDCALAGRRNKAVGSGHEHPTAPPRAWTRLAEAGVAGGPALWQRV
ncbi:hypothetical protein BJY59DRAFT_707164 [Rhodotorula toruloides]